MKTLRTRVTWLEQTLGRQEPAPPWAMPWWEQLSEAARRTAGARYFASLSDVELEVRVATLKAQEGATP